MPSSKQLTVVSLNHLWDEETDYCERCGVGREYVEKYGVACAPDDGKVQGISHLIAKRRKAKLMKDIAKAKK